MDTIPYIRKINPQKKPRFISKRNFITASKSSSSSCECSSCEKMEKSVLIICRMVVYFVTIGLAIHIIANSIVHYRDNAPITRISSNNIPVKKIRFPAVSVCNNNKVSRLGFKRINTILSMHNINQLEINDFAKSLHFLTSFSTYNYYHRIIQNHTRIFSILQKNNYSVGNIMKEVMQSCETLITHCLYQKQLLNCKTHIKVIKTTEGYCCAFNYYGGEKKRLRKDREKTVYSSGEIMDSGLTLNINVDPTDYMSPARPCIAAIILISDFRDFPGTTAKHLTLSHRKLARVTIEPGIIRSSSDLYRIPTDRRMCYLESDIPVERQPYKYHNCLVKCNAEMIHETCDCVPFFYPSYLYENSTHTLTSRFCELKDMECLSKHKAKLHSFAKDNLTAVPLKNLCGCLPECNDKFYKIKAHISSIWTSRLLDDEKIVTTFNNTSKVMIYFKFNTGVKYWIEPFIYWNDIIASNGGTLSLCFGGSVISIVEIFFNLLFKRCLPYIFKKRTGRNP